MKEKLTYYEPSLRITLLNKADILDSSPSPLQERPENGLVDGWDNPRAFD